MINERVLLRPVGAIYAMMADRDRRRKLAERWQSRLPVISVGNLSVGGTGKTPLVIHLAREILKRRPVLVLSRGYGRDSKEDLLWRSGDAPPEYLQFGDEPTLIADAVGGASVAVGGDRAALLRKLEPEFPDAVALLDDGFQHHRLARDLDIVILDDRTAELPWPMPAGILRERIDALQRAQVILPTSDRAEELARRHAAPDADIIRLGFRSTPPVAWKGGRPLDPAVPALLVTGIAQPQRVVDALAGMGITPKGTLFFRDHQRYLPRELSEIRYERGRVKAGPIITTAKDAVKLQWHTDLAPLLYVVGVNVIISEPDRLMARVWSAIESKST